MVSVPENHREGGHCHEAFAGGTGLSFVLCRNTDTLLFDCVAAVDHSNEYWRLASGTGNKQRSSLLRFRVLLYRWSFAPQIDFFSDRDGI